MVGFCPPIGFAKDFRLGDMTIKSPEPPLLVGLRLDVYLSPQVLQTPGSLYHASLPPVLSKDVLRSRAPSLRPGYVVLAIVTTTGSSATLSPFRPLRPGLIGLPLLPLFPAGTRRVSPVDRTPVYPCRRCYPATALAPSLPVASRGYCLRLT